MKVIRKEAILEVEKTVDVLVVGGGPAGVGAAVSAARNGAKVLLLEKRAFLGGNITACYVENCNYFLKPPFHSEGIYAEIESGCKEEFGNDNIRTYNPKAFCSEYLKVFLDRFVQKAGVEIYFHAFVNEVVVTGDHIDAIIIQTKKGPLAVAAEIIIDTTGDADVAFAAGVPFEQGREKDGLCQPGTVSVRFAGADMSKLASDPERIARTADYFRHSSITCAGVCHCTGPMGLEVFAQTVPAYLPTGAGLVWQTPSFARTSAGRKES